MEKQMSNSGLKKAVIVGAIAGALITLGAALSMDYFLSASLQGTWRDAAIKDVTRIFGPSCGQNWLAVSIALWSVMAFLAGFGALLGIIGAVIINRFFKMLLK